VARVTLIQLNGICKNAVSTSNVFDDQLGQGYLCRRLYQCLFGRLWWWFVWLYDNSDDAHTSAYYDHASCNSSCDDTCYAGRRGTYYACCHDTDSSCDDTCYAGRGCIYTNCGHADAHACCHPNARYNDRHASDLLTRGELEPDRSADSLGVQAAVPQHLSLRCG
jgi:hypothetical protein